MKSFQLKLNRFLDILEIYFDSRYKYIAIFAVASFVRILYLFLTDFDHFSHSADAPWIVELAGKASKGDFGYDIGRFIAAPFAQSLIGVLKIVSNKYWGVMYLTIQILLSSYSVVILCKLSRILFDSSSIELYTGFLYILFPMTLYWVGTYSSESNFQSFLIISVYFLCNGVINKKIIYIFISSILFGLAFLSKSHVLLFSPFIVVYIFISKFIVIRKITTSLLYALVCITMALPYSIYCYQKYDTFVLSSNGFGYQYYLGNTEYGYVSIVDVPEKGTKQFDQMQTIQIGGEVFNGKIDRHIMNMSINKKQAEYLKYSINWSMHNIEKVLKIKIYNLFFFLFPGVSFRHYDFLPWLLSFVISFPIYIGGYAGIYRALKTDFSKHFWILGLLSSMTIFSVVLYVQNRFRTITLEPFYLMYCAYAISFYFGRVKESQTAQK